MGWAVEEPLLVASSEVLSLLEKKRKKKKVSDFYLFLIGLVNTAQCLEIMFSKQ